MTDFPQTPPLDQTVKSLIGHVLPPLFDLFETEDNKLVDLFYFPSGHSRRLVMKDALSSLRCHCARENDIITLKILIHI